MLEDIKEVLISRESLNENCKKLGKEISEDYQGKDLVLIGVLKGGCIFFADIMREISIPMEIDLIAVSSYGASTKSSGIVRIIKDTDIDVKGKHVLIVEDLVDTGLTLKHIKELFLSREPLSVKVCTALDKPARRVVDIEVEYQGLFIPDEFVVGYGLDYNEKYRNLPEVCILKPEVYQ